MSLKKKRKLLVGKGSKGGRRESGLIISKYY